MAHVCRAWRSLVFKYDLLEEFMERFDEDEDYISDWIFTRYKSQLFTYIPNKFGRFWVYLNFQICSKILKERHIRQRTQVMLCPTDGNCGSRFNRCLSIQKEVIPNIALSVAPPPGGSQHKLKVKLWIRLNYRKWLIWAA